MPGMSVGAAVAVSHHEWRATLPLSMCGAVLRAWAKVAKG
ncbi:hypothetical protein SAMN02927895_05291 [Belnapia rosea]|nr:hypothetical protein SAMN02927895_05291 [Belnapia rosea]